MPSVTVAAYGSWSSSITDASLRMGHCRCHTELKLDMTDFGVGTVYWIEERVDGRCVVVSSLVDGASGNRTDWTPTPFSATSRVHEYGGGPLVVHAGVVYFTTVNCIYRQTTPDSVPDPLVDPAARLRFAEPCFGHDSLYVVCEDHSGVDESNIYPTNRIVRIHPASATTKDGAYVYPTMTTIGDGADFYAKPALSPSGKLIAWMQWDHPNMRLVVVDVATSARRTLTSGYTHHQAVHVRDNAVYCVASAPDRPEAVIRVDLTSGDVTVLHETFASALIDAGVTSVPELVKFATPTADSTSMASGYFYAPKNDAFRAPANTLPPVIIGAHGGPTGKALNDYQVKKQFWTSRGFAYFDVNYRGSSGFGRKFRDVLVGHCGVIDIDDCAAAAKHLVAAGLVDANKLCIMGNSAGGYVVLCSILRAGMYAVGVSNYGIAELAPLMAETHKFESHYDVFAGKSATAEERQRVYAERSPINHLDAVTCPVAFFQGLDDVVVLPNQAIGMYDAVKSKGLTTALTLFEGEGHGFKQKANVATALYGAHYFMCTVLGIPCTVDADTMAKVKIVNLKK